jgi:adenine-specific DNA-methyltransferase
MMEKLNMQTPNITEQNIEQIAKLFPNVVTETQDENGSMQKAIDFDLLKQTLSSVLVEDADERYRLDWPGKKASLLKANTPITKTLRPYREESVNFDTTENVYIEGDNFEVLKILQESYLGKIKMIYIDPPYNTGKDFIYKDSFKVSKSEYEEEIGAVDEEGDKLFKNTDSNGHFHSDWLSMMYERLMVARDLLKDDGVVFISIDDNEVHNLRKICDEIFGEENALLNFIWELPRGINAGFISKAHELILVYAKSTNDLNLFYKDKPEISIERCNKKIDSRHPESAIQFPKGIKYEGGDQEIDGIIGGSEAVRIEGKLIFRNGELAQPVTLHAGWTMKGMISKWLQGQEVFDLKGQKILEFYFQNNGKLYSKKEIKFISPKSILKGLGDSQNGRKTMQSLFDSEDIFDYPKPVNMIKKLVSFITKKEDIILDFFAGSSPTAHAVMQLNAEDNGNRKFIMVQLPEQTDKKSEAYKAGYKTIAEIGKERIRRAGQKIVEDNQDKESIEKLDIGFRVYKTDTTNMKDVYYHPEQLNQQDLLSTQDNIKEDRTPDDLLTQVILDLGLELNLPIEKIELLGNNLFIVQTNALVACFDDNINFGIVDEIAKLTPFKVVFKDASFEDDKDRINVEERFKRLSPDTLITVI